MTAEYEILVPDEAMVLAAFNHSVSRRFGENPVSTLLGLNLEKIRERANYLMQDARKEPPRL